MQTHLNLVFKSAQDSHGTLISRRRNDCCNTLHYYFHSTHLSNPFHFFYIFSWENLLLPTVWQKQVKLLVVNCLGCINFFCFCCFKICIKYAGSNEYFSFLSFILIFVTWLLYGSWILLNSKIDKGGLKRWQRYSADNISRFCSCQTTTTTTTITIISRLLVFSFFLQRRFYWHHFFLLALPQPATLLISDLTNEAKASKTRLRNDIHRRSEKNWKEKDCLPSFDFWAERKSEPQI